VTIAKTSEIALSRRNVDLSVWLSGAPFAPPASAEEAKNGSLEERSGWFEKYRLSSCT